MHHRRTAHRRGLLVVGADRDALADGEVKDMETPVLPGQEEKAAEEEKTGGEPMPYPQGPYRGEARAW